MLNEYSPFSEHGDVLHAEPTDDHSKRALVEELKNRAKAVFTSKNYPVADALYSKAIQVMPDATLYSNRSAVRSGLGQYDSALHDANESLKLDPTYTKAFYRKGQACLGLGISHAQEALDSFKAGAVLDPKNKVWNLQIENANLLVSKRDSAAEPVKEKAQIKTLPTQVKTSPLKAEKVSSTSSDISNLEQLRGYKKTADGRTTTYFHRELTEEEKAIIGDIAPKKIDVSTVDILADKPVEVASSSAWNTAGTWEERNVTVWSKDRLEALLCEINNIETPAGAIKVAEVSDISGDASISFSRGKRRSLFDFSVKLVWEGSFECGPAKGTIEIPDMGYDSCGQYEMIFNIDKLTPPAARPFIDTYVKGEGKGLRPAIIAKIAQYVDELQNK